MYFRPIKATFFVFLVIFFSYSACIAKPTVKGLRTAEHQSSTRVVIDLSEEVEFSSAYVSNPDRLIVNFTDITWPISRKKILNSTILKSFKFIDLNKKNSRLTFFTKDAIEIKEIFLLPPKNYPYYRLVIDFSKKQMKKSNKKNNLTIKTNRDSYKYNLPNVKPSISKNNVKIIVIDAGHGGKDPGAVGLNGTLEKDVTLAVALVIKSKLKKQNKYKVILTRSRDRFLKLRDRVNVGKSTKADLFISLHADSIKNRSIRGGSVYTLSEKASDKEAEALANRENRADLIGVKSDLDKEDDDVAKILISLVQRETMNHSLIFASDLIYQFNKVGKMLRKGHRQAGFVVLKSPDVPSVLVEMGFLSNKIDEKKLNSIRFQEKIADTIIDSIEIYFDKLD